MHKYSMTVEERAALNKKLDEEMLEYHQSLGVEITTYDGLEPKEFSTMIDYLTLTNLLHKVKRFHLMTFNIKETLSKINPIFLPKITITGYILSAVDYANGAEQVLTECLITEHKDLIEFDEVIEFNGIKTKYLMWYESYNKDDDFGDYYSDKRDTLRELEQYFLKIRVIIPTSEQIEECLDRKGCWVKQ